ncbi:MAG: hypothetical protein EBR82_69575 [Caulobacteraceae bacterium]|jgi:hypothetical protein|nr:hypothetical protein [Caulobacteraceae bacterium]
MKKYRVKKIQRFNNVKGISPNDDFIGVPLKFMPIEVEFFYDGKCWTYYAESPNDRPSITIEMIDKNDKSKTYPVVFFNLNRSY